MDLSTTVGARSLRPRLAELCRRSRQLITSHQHASGAFPASPTFPVYEFCWLRDGSFVADGLSRQGEADRAEAFHHWCGDVLLSRRDRVDDIAGRLGQGLPVGPEEFLPTRYTLEGDDAEDDWWNFQLDGYGTWLWALCTHLRRHRRDPLPYRKSVEIAAAYLIACWELPCYDWWEEHPDHLHVSTLGSIAAGFAEVLALGLLDRQLAADTAVELERIRARVRADGVAGGHLVKWLGGEAVDGSLLACLTPLALTDRITAAATLSAIERDLVVDDGVFRYLGDTFYGGGRWVLLAGFLGLARLHLGHREAAMAALGWMAGAATPSDELPEQVSSRLLHPERFDEWLGRWGPVATPLLWSHGMFLVLADELGIHG
jgi:GH15 family glucan-1,4-alpha-glucosidase